MAINERNKLKRIIQMKAILLIDDHSIFTKIFAAYLLRTKYRGYKLENAADVYSATEHLKSKTFDLIVLDNRIPPYFNYLESIKLLEDANWCGPILLISGEAIVLNANRPDSHCVKSFLLKDDMNAHSLEQAIGTCLK